MKYILIFIIAFLLSRFSYDYSLSRVVEKDGCHIGITGYEFCKKINLEELR